MGNSAPVDGLLVVLSLDEEISASRYDVARGIGLAVERIGGDQRAGEIFSLFDQSLRGLHLAIVAFPFLAAGFTHGPGHAGFVIDKADDADSIADELAIHCQGCR